MRPVDTYGCVKCQKRHYEDAESEIYNLHIKFQSKHGIEPVYESMQERKMRYDEAANPEKRS